jgi:adenosylcobinamide amidohydrolase
VTAPATVSNAARDAGEREVSLERVDRFLVARFAVPHDVVSWAIVGGGARVADAVAWVQVEDRELRPPVDAVAFVRDHVTRLGLPASRTVVLVTSRQLDAYVEASCDVGDVRATCVATVGLGNALRAGDPPGPCARIGTINVMCRVSRSLSPEALLEASAIATEAKAAAVLEARVPSGRTGRVATGTGTDCVVVAAPSRTEQARRAGRAAYAGKHTEVGAAVGECVGRAVASGVHAWLRERGLA